MLFAIEKLFFDFFIFLKNKASTAFYRKSTEWVKIK